MEITMEQVKKLREYADVSFREAKTALEKAEGDMLGALIALEEQGKIPPGGGSYRTDRPYAGTASRKPDDEEGRSRHAFCEGRNRSNHFRLFWGKLRELIHKGNINHFEIWRKEERVVDMPVNLWIIVLVFFFWVVMPALVLALFFGFRYRFRGPDLEREMINQAMEKASSAAEDIRRSVCEHDGGARGGENSAH